MDFQSLTTQSDILKADGMQILEQKGLRKILSDYGKLEIIGSFDFDLLTKPDLDLYVRVEEYDIKKHFEVLGTIAEQLLPLRIKYLDLRQANWPEFPMHEGLFIGINIEINGIEWSVDGWALKEDVFTERVTYHNHMKSLITLENKPILFQIKNDIYKNKNYRSGDLYSAVLEEGIASTSEYYSWYEKKYAKPFKG